MITALYSRQPAYLELASVGARIGGRGPWYPADQIETVALRGRACVLGPACLPLTLVRFPSFEGPHAIPGLPG
jgi:hypothetical protein